MSDIVLIVTLYLCIEAVSEWEGVRWGLGEILTNPGIVKVCHDGRVLR